jgi:hypothetical protein
MKSLRQLQERLRVTRRRFIISTIIPFLEFHEKIAKIRPVWANSTPIQRILLVTRWAFDFIISLPWVIQALIVCGPLLPITIYLLPPEYRPQESEKNIRLLYLIGAGGLVIYYAFMLAILPRIAPNLFDNADISEEDK